MPKNPPRARGVGVHDTHGGWKEAPRRSCLGSPACHGGTGTWIYTHSKPLTCSQPSRVQSSSSAGDFPGPPALLCSARGEDKSEGSLPPLGKHQHRHLL